ncbi:MAG: phosphonate transport system permease protein [Chlamydiales bacterium]
MEQRLAASIRGMTSRANEITRLHRDRPRSRLLRVSLLILTLLGLGSWLWTAVGAIDMFGARRLTNLRRFVAHDAMPYPFRDGEFSWRGLGDWIATIWEAQARAGATSTLWIAVVAILIAGSLALPLALLGARVLAASDPFLPGGIAGQGESRWTLRRTLALLVRSACVAMRAIPEYVLAFLFLAILGSSPWAAILALALHNAGILGRLGTETIENLDVMPLRAVRLAGADRRALALWVALPLAFPRFLLYFFYRFETCVREATVLGILGIASLGAFVQEARARQRYDEMLFLILIGGAIVLLADLASQLARTWIRRET